MKASIIFIFLVLSLQLSAQDSMDIITEQKINLLLNKAQAKTISAEEAKELKAFGNSLQNQGFFLDERHHDYKGSLEKMNKALILWIALKDTTNEANNRKYKGYLLGRLGLFAEAKEEIATAIYLYKSKNIGFGVAVSQYDLAQVYNFESKYDSALHYASIVLKFWREKKDTPRILIINNLMQELLRKTKQYKYAQRIQKESGMLSVHNNLHWQEIIDFYFVSYQLYKKLKRNKSAVFYKKLYEEKIRMLKDEGIIARSFYDI